MRYLIIAEEGEREMALRLFPDTPVIITGVGALNIIRSLKDLPRDAELINIGYAGSANYPIGTWVRVNEVRLHHPNVSYDEPTICLNGKAMPADPEAFTQAPLNTQEPLNTQAPLITAVCYTNVDFVLASPYQDCVFDMELAFIAALGFTNLTSFKYVSDNLSLHQYHEKSQGVS